MENEKDVEKPAPANGEPAHNPPPVGFTPIAQLTPNTTVNVLAVCASEPWLAKRNLWKIWLSDPTGEISLSMKGTGFKCKVNDIVAANSVHVNEYVVRRPNVYRKNGGLFLTATNNSEIVSDPEGGDEVLKITEWHQNTVSEKNKRHASEGFVPVADVTKKTTANVLAVCIRDPWQVGARLWKTLLRDSSGVIVAMKFKAEFGFKMDDVVAAYSAFVGEFKGESELEFRYNTDVVVNPESDEASKLKEWYQKEISQVDEQPITPIVDLKKNTTANVLAVCTSDPMERPTFGSKKVVWQATLRDASGNMNVMQEGDSFSFKLNDVIEARRIFVREFILGAEMVVDEHTVITVNPDTEEANNLREWYKSQGARDSVTSMEVSDEKPVDVANSSNGNIKSESNKNHAAGKSHSDAVETKNRVAPNCSSEPPAKKSKPDQTMLRCDICDVPISGQPSYDAHIKGSKHMKRLQENELAALFPTLPHIEKLGKNYRCTLCNADLGSNKTIIENHLKGAKHTKAAGKAGTAEV